MTDIHKKKEEQATNTANTVLAGIAGVVAGGVAVAAAVVLSDKDNQKKITDAFIGTKDKVQPIIEKNTQKLKSAVNNTKQKIEEKV